jgi:competence ComEA-like helix-hairpin-helix protein
LTVLALWATQGLCAKKKPPLYPGNLNTASSTELQQVPGIGPATAEKILQTRKAHGAFKSVNDLQTIKGIGPKKLEKMRKYLTVGKPATEQEGFDRGYPWHENPCGKEFSGEARTRPKGSITSSERRRRTLEFSPAAPTSLAR